MAQWRLITLLLEVDWCCCVIAEISALRFQLHWGERDSSVTVDENPKAAVPETAGAFGGLSGQLIQVTGQSDRAAPGRSCTKPLFLGVCRR
jgi:hypothetical protein